MDELLTKLKERVIRASSDTSFIHHDWYAKYHLAVVEQMSMELCDCHPEANRQIVSALVWVHDYIKIVDKENEHNLAFFEKIRDLMKEIGFDGIFIDSVVTMLTTFEQKMEIDLNTAPIEVRIVSSADAASHLIGPFYAIYFRENPELSIEEYMKSCRKKLEKDWNRKMVLPEAKKQFEERYRFTSEQFGNFPQKYF